MSRRQLLSPSTRTVSHKGLLLKKLAAHRVLYPSILIESWVVERGAQVTGITAAEYYEATAIQEFGGDSQRVDWGCNCHIPCVKPLLNQRRQKCLTWVKEKKDWTAAQWSKVFFSDESTFAISFGNQAPRVWRKTRRKHLFLFLVGFKWNYKASQNSTIIKQNIAIHKTLRCSLFKSLHTLTS